MLEYPREFCRKYATYEGLKALIYLHSFLKMKGMHWLNYQPKIQQRQWGDWLTYEEAF